MDISSYNRTYYILENDITRLKDSNISILCGNAENLLSQVTNLVSFANMKAKEDSKLEDKKLQEKTDELFAGKEEFNRRESDMTKMITKLN